MKTTKIKFQKPAFVVLVAIFLSLCLNAQSVKDINGKTYKTVKIGQKEWMAQNLDVACFRNGDSIPHAATPEEWQEAGASGKPAWCYYNNSDSIGSIYGKLYNYFAITDPRGLAPAGWHIPSNADWTATTKFLGGVDLAGNKMKCTSGWSNKNKGNNKSGFCGLPGGFRDEKGKFSNVNQMSLWWSVDKLMREPSQIYTLKLKEAFGEVFYDTADSKSGLSVRVVKD